MLLANTSPSAGAGMLCTAEAFRWTKKICVGIFGNPNIRTRLLNPNIFGYSEASSSEYTNTVGECMCKDRKPGLRSAVYGTVNQAFFLVVKRVCASGLRSGGDARPSISTAPFILDLNGAI